MRMPHGSGGPRGSRTGDGRPKEPLLKILKRFWPFIKPYMGAILFGSFSVLLALAVQKVHPLITRFLVDRVLTPVIQDPGNVTLRDLSLRRLLLATAAMFGLAAFGSLIACARMRVMQRAGAAMVMNLRLHVFRHLQRLSLSYYESRQTGEIMSRVTGDVNAMEQLVTGVSEHLLNDVLNLVVTLVILFVLSWQLALVSLIPVPPLLIMILFFSKRIRPLYRETRDRMGTITARLQDNISGIRVVKSFHREDTEARHFEADNQEYFDVRMKGVKLWSTAFPAFHFLQALGNILVTAVGGYMILRPQPVISLGDLFAFNAYVMSLYMPIGNLFRLYDSVLRSVAAGERVLEVIDVDPEIADAPDAVDLPPVAGRVHFDHVSFQYKTGNPVLQDVTIEAKPGTIVALVGRSGAGKTTFVNLIPRFYDPTGGTVTIDGRDLKTVTRESLRRQIAIVLQEAFLFNGKLIDNIRYGRPEASQDDIIAAARAARAHEFIVDLPDGYETEIGERGIKLSGGQRQRVSIARAILANRRILILDEATSMVDTESEILIQEALDNLMAGRTTFVIAHRLSTVKHADAIVVLEHGRILETGTHEQLMQRSGRYAEMVRMQFRDVFDDIQAARAATTPVGSPQLPSFGSEDTPLDLSK